MRFRYGTDIGLKREENQDAVRCEYFGHNVLAVVCDGMGGERAGKEASELAIEEFFQRFSADYKESLSDEDIRKLLISSVSAANSVIYTRARFDFKNFGMGTTCVAATIADDILYVANVGDSRLYLIDKSITQVTKDHSLVAELVRKGTLDATQAKGHPDKNIITRAIGAAPNVDIDFFEVELTPGDIVLMCTDGLTNMVEDDEILSIVRRGVDVADAAENLIKMANHNGGKDNIGVVLVEVTQ